VAVSDWGIRSTEPPVEEALADLGVGVACELAPKILAHHRDSKIVELECHAQAGRNVGIGNGLHAAILARGPLASTS